MKQHMDDGERTSLRGVRRVRENSFQQMSAG